MWDLRAALEVFQISLGAVSCLCFLVGIQSKQAKARRRKRIPFIIVLCAMFLALLADMSVLFVSAGWMPDSSPLAAAILYMLALILQIDRLYPSSDVEKSTEPAWHAYFWSWAAMFVFDMVAIIKLALASRSPTPSLVCAGVRCCFELILLILSIRPYVQLPRIWIFHQRIRLPDDDEFPDDDERIRLPDDLENGTMGMGNSHDQEGGSSEPTEQGVLRQSVGDELNAAGGFWPWLKRFRIFLPWIWPSGALLTRLRIVAILVLQLANTGLTLVIPRLHGAFVEILAQKFAGEKSGLVWLLLLAYSAAIISSYGVYFLDDLLQNQIKLDRRRLASTSINQHLMRHEASFHLQTDSTDINMAIDNGTIACETFDFVVWEMLPQIVTVITAEIAIFSLFGLHVGLIQGAVVAVDTIFVLRSNRGQMTMYDAKITAHQETKRRREGGLKAWLTVFLCGQVDREIDDYAALLHKQTRLELKILISSFRFQLSSGIFVTAGSFFATGIAIQHGLQTGDTFGPVVMFMNYWELVQGPLKSFMKIPERLSRDLYTADRLRRLLEIKPKMQYGSAVLRPARGGIRLQNVSFSYPNASGKVESVFKDLTLSIVPGETVAFVGPSGVGKSTIFNLITRLFDPNEGSVEIDGQDIRKLQKGELIEHMAVLSQEPCIFDGTIRSNITYGRDGATDAEMHAAARMAGIHDEIMKMEKHYDTKIGESGRNLSGGQRQRVALARVFLRGALITLLDEATSAVDTGAEDCIKESVKKRDKTTLLIAHRLSSITYADRIIVFGKGEDGCGMIVEEGTHEELKERNGVYTRLWKNSTGEKNIEQIFDGGTSGMRLPNNGSIRRRGGEMR
ncbi:hypothetical protein CEP51_013484 [Fusarium floridanum]|uniref:ABC transporter domain-containing protein n=1 Tax=Fusarium floridanum TaxID=1325733 RepID=A0A428QAU9_9HYPO|nr:hypothetical protein CEP51_013484 [Fusarium floridanum]